MVVTRVVGVMVGDPGTGVGPMVGVTVGIADGIIVGMTVGVAEGAIVGAGVGMVVGRGTADTYLLGQAALEGFVKM